MLTLIDSTVSATIRQSDSAPIASEAATALIRREEATGAAWPSTPAARGDRVMAGNPRSRRITGTSGLVQFAGEIRAKRPRDRGIAANGAIIPAISSP